MSKGYASEIRALLLTCRIGSLATIGKNGPEASMAPYAIDQGHIILHLSKLARHTGNIADHPEAGFMICMPEASADSPLSLPRLSLQGNVVAVPEDECDTIKSIYIETIPDAEPLFQFSDFRLFKLTPSFIYWVGGFGSAKSIALHEWPSLLENENMERS